ncbi:hypothetical protein [Kitasatospora sp. GP82]|uniref:hypothetical protein n=1 Tax=Kitasatospora sp. GP82 TaxID=3035089 RepID=UPI0024771E8E|nr:hypothetical protein [Kitasatospora sp. GP82]MDH6130045.1 hypothetical protein [Kitasatospora sp. GP82]
MTEHDTTAREPIGPAQANALRSWADRERHNAETLAQVLEDIAVNGLPNPETGIEWEELRERHLAELASGQTEQRVA